MNELVSAIAMVSPVSINSSNKELGDEQEVKQQRMETHNDSSAGPPDSNSYNIVISRPAKSQSLAPPPRSPPENQNQNNGDNDNDNDGQDDQDDTRETRTPPTVHPAEQRYRNSPPPPLSAAYQQHAQQHPHHYPTYAHPHHAPHHAHAHHQSPNYYRMSPTQQHPLHLPPNVEHTASAAMYDPQHPQAQHYRVSRRTQPPVPPHPSKVLPSATESFRSGGCTCKKSRCLKLYCQCFASSTTCGPKCKCVACHNSTLHADSIEKARQTILERNPAAFDDKFQKQPKQDPFMYSHSGHGHGGGGGDLFNKSPSRHHYDHHHHHHQQQQQQPHHMPYTQLQQPFPPPPPPPPPLPPPQLPPATTSTTTTTSTTAATTTTAKPSSLQHAASGYSYSPPAYASPLAGSNSGGMRMAFGQQQQQQQKHQHLQYPPLPLPITSRVNKFGCKCKRSFCLKKYCECYQNSTHCGLNCKCTNCRNFPDVDHFPDVEQAGAAVGVAVATNNTGTTMSPTTAMLTPTINTGSTCKIKENRFENMTMPPMPMPMPMPRRHMTTTMTSAGEEQVDTRPVSVNEEKQQQQQQQQEQPQDKDEGRMAMMAAVAMAELCGGLTSLAPEQTETFSATPAPRRISNEREMNQDYTSNGKRKAEEETLSRAPLKKRKPMEHSTALADEEVRAVVSSTSSLSAESRNPSPVSNMRSPYYPPADRFPYHMPPHNGRYPPHGHGHASHRASPVLHRDPYSNSGGSSSSMMPSARASPPPYEYSRPLSARYLQPSPPPTFRSSPTPYARSSPPPGMYNNGVTPSPYKQTGSYDEIVRSSGLPKSLSFRKICSKCGKTRGEHGELGFGNKCVYQECGKCGAGQHMHERAGQPMGVLCCLTVEDGATAGAGAAYERKIRELAARADLQRELQRRKQEATQDIVQRCQEASATSTDEVVDGPSVQ